MEPNNRITLYIYGASTHRKSCLKQLLFGLEGVFEAVEHASQAEVVIVDSPYADAMAVLDAGRGSRIRFVIHHQAAADLGVQYEETLLRSQQSTKVGTIHHIVLTPESLETARARFQRTLQSCLGRQRLRPPPGPSTPRSA